MVNLKFEVGGKLMEIDDFNTLLFISVDLYLSNKAACSPMPNSDYFCGPSPTPPGPMPSLDYYCGPRPTPPGPMPSLDYYCGPNPPPPGPMPSSDYYCTNL